MKPGTKPSDYVTLVFRAIDPEEPYFHEMPEYKGRKCVAFSASHSMNEAFEAQKILAKLLESGDLNSKQTREIEDYFESHDLSTAGLLD